MKSLVITPKDTKELNFVSELLQKMGISSKILSEEEKEDAGLLILMQEANKNDTVSRQEIVSKLRA
jgi:hypothetical protein